MGLTSGLGATFGYGLETAYGEAATIAKFLEFEGSPLKSNQNYLEGKQIGSGSLFQRGSRVKNTTKSADGSTKLQIPTVGFGGILNLLHGATVTPAQQESTAAYLQTHPVGLTDPSGKSITGQLREPMVTGETITPFTYPGLVVMKIEITVSVDGYVMANVTWDGREENRTTSVATPELPTGIESFDFSQAELKINGTAVSLARSFTLTYDIPRDTSRFYLGSAGLKQKPLMNDLPTVSITMLDDYGDNVIYDFFQKGERKSVELILKGPVIASTFHKELKLAMAECAFTEGGSPQVTGPGVLQQNPVIKAFYNGSVAPLIATYMSTDTAL